MTTHRFTALLMVSAMSLSIASADTTPRLMYDGTADDRAIVTPVEERVIYHLATHSAAMDAWKDKQNCDGSDFQVTGNAHGSFTRKNSAQNAYLYEYCQLGNSHDQGLVITENGRIIEHHIFHQSLYGLSALKDINRNGLSELLMSGIGTGAGGMTDGYLLLVEYSGSRPKIIGQLPSFYDECGAVADSHVNYDARLYVTPGPRPTFEIQKFFRTCAQPHGSTPGRRTSVRLNTSFPQQTFTSSTLVPARSEDTLGLSGVFDSTASILDTEICRKYSCTGAKYVTGPSAGTDQRVDIAYNTYYAVRYNLKGGGTVETRRSSEAPVSQRTGYLELKLPLTTKTDTVTTVVQAFLRSGLGDKIAARVSPKQILKVCTVDKEPIYASNPSGYGLFAVCEQKNGNYLVSIVAGE